MRIAFLYIFLWACTVNNTEAQTVHITKTGTKYHIESCHYLSNSKYPITLSKAQAQDYQACKVCKPSTTVSNTNYAIDSTKRIDPPKPVQNAIARQCAATAKTTGNRCKRTTKNASGKCWQHE